MTDKKEEMTKEQEDYVNKIIAQAHTEAEARGELWAILNKKGWEVSDG